MIIGDRIRERRAESTGLTRKELALNKIFVGVLELENDSAVTPNKTQLQDIELLRDRLSRYYDKVRGVV